MCVHVCVCSMVVSMQLAYVLKCSPFFNSLDNDFLDAGTPENEGDNVKQVRMSHALVCGSVELLYVIV